MSSGMTSEPRPWAGLDPDLELLAPGPGAGGIEAFLDRTQADGGGPSWPAFDDARLAVLRDLSETLLAHPVLRRDPATVAVAFWMRPASVQRLRTEFARRVEADPMLVLVPVGRVFHVAPANVDTLFIYSWALSFLCGNANVVRLSRERGVVVEGLLEVMRAVASRHEALAFGNRFVTYAHDERVSAALSAWCGHRVVWGGDDTVAALRSVPLNPHASERVFGSKFSYSVFSAAAYRAAGPEERARVAGAFFNDMFWFDQMACSSPHLLFWVGTEPGIEEETRAFEAALEAEVVRRGLVTSAANAVLRRAFAFDLAADVDVRVGLGHSGFIGVQVNDPRGLGRETCGGGLIRHAHLGRMEELAAFAREGDQTVTHYGFSAAELAATAFALGSRGVDRLVPVGEALAFDAVWDGYDLLADFTRRVRVKPA